MIPALQRHAGSRSTPEDLEQFELRALQILECQPHSELCVSRADRAGEDGWDYGYNAACSCGLNTAIDEAGGRIHRRPIGRRQT